jgi:hypothetical protein
MFTNNDVSGLASPITASTICIGASDYNGHYTTNPVIDHNTIHDCGDSSDGLNVGAQGPTVSSGLRNGPTRNQLKVHAQCPQL